MVTMNDVRIRKGACCIDGVAAFAGRNHGPPCDAHGCHHARAPPELLSAAAPRSPPRAAHRDLGAGCVVCASSAGRGHGQQQDSERAGGGTGVRRRHLARITGGSRESGRYRCLVIVAVRASLRYRRQTAVPPRRANTRARLPGPAGWAYSCACSPLLRCTALRKAGPARTVAAAAGPRCHQL